MKVKYQDELMTKRIILSNYLSTSAGKKADPQTRVTANMNVKPITVSYTEENPMGNRP